MKRILLLSFYFLVFSCIQAQITHTANGNVDETANKILKAAAGKLGPSAVRFSVTVVNYDSDRQETFRQKATVYYKAPSYVVQAGDLELYCDGVSVWQVNKKASEVVITPMTDADDNLTNPARLLATYNKNFRAKYIRQEEDGTAIIDLQPRKACSYHKLRLFIDTKTSQIKKIEQHNYDSSRGEYTFSNYTKCKTPPDFFTYTPPKNYEVVDMR